MHRITLRKKLADSMTKRLYPEGRRKTPKKAKGKKSSPKNLLRQSRAAAPLLIEVDGARFIHDEETDTLYNTEGEPVGNLVDGKPVLDINDQTESMSDESDEDDEVSDDSDDDSE